MKTQYISNLFLGTMALKKIVFVDEVDFDTETLSKSQGSDVLIPIVGISDNDNYGLMLMGADLQ